MLTTLLVGKLQIRGNLSLFSIVPNLKVINLRFKAL